MHAEIEEQTQSLLGPSPESLASVKVFPLIPHLKKDVIVRVGIRYIYCGELIHA
jgi:hypothetical protein